MDYQSAYTFIINKLTYELRPEYKYHDRNHTQSVIESAVMIAASEGITNEQDITILKTAALFHDVGMIIGSENHEATSCQFAKKHLPEFGYGEAQIEQICKMIMATKVPQNPTNQLSEILCDADLYYLGTADYYSRAQLLYEEFKTENKIQNQEQWIDIQIRFLTAHNYFTNTARKHGDNQKAKVLQNLRSKATASHPPKNNYFKNISDIILIIFGVSLAALALKGFFVPNHFFDGGITGVSLLMHELTHINLALVLFAFNLPFIIVSYFTVGKTFAYKTMFAAVLLGLLITIMPDLKFTSDKLLVAIFGGVLLGVGVGIVMRAGSALDGIEVLAMYTLKRTSFTITEIIMAINICIFTIAAFKFGIETALYSMLTYFCATRTIDYVIEGIQAYLGVTIVSSSSEEIKHLLVENMRKGITVYKGERGYLPNQFDQHSECDILFTVITRLELRKLKNLIHELDPQAFVYVSSIKEAAGGILKRVSGH